MHETRLQRLAGNLVSRPFVYDLVQSLARQAKVAARLRVALNAFLPVGPWTSGAPVADSPTGWELDLCASISTYVLFWLCGSEGGRPVRWRAMPLNYPFPTEPST